MLVLQNGRVLPELTPQFDGAYADIAVENGRLADMQPAGSVKTGEVEEEALWKIQIP